MIFTGSNGVKRDLSPIGTRIADKNCRYSYVGFACTLKRQSLGEHGSSPRTSALFKRLTFVTVMENRV
jgi:hypothetical protein